MKDIKVKPKNTKPKILEKASTMPRDAKYLAIEQLEKRADEKRAETANNPSNYATDTVEDKMQSAANKSIYAADKAKDYAVRKFKEHREEKAYQNAAQKATTEVYDTPQQLPRLQERNADIPQNTPKTRESANNMPASAPSSAPKEKAQAYVKSKQTEKIKTFDAMKSDIEPAPAADMKIKTKDQYLKSQHKPQITELDTKPKTLADLPKRKQSDMKIKSGNTAQSEGTAPITATPKQKAKEFVIKKQNDKKAAENLQDNKVDILPDKTEFAEAPAALEKPDGHIKTKEFYRSEQAASKPSIKTKRTDIKLSERAERETLHYQGLSDTKANKNIVNHTKDIRIKQKNISENTIKPKQVNSAKFKLGKNVKTSTRFIKKNNPAKIAQKKATAAVRKKAAKNAAQETAKRTAQAAKATAKATVKITVKVAQAVAHAVKALVSALAALGGWAVLVVVLIVIIIIAAIAASPFGIFISDEAADADSIPLSSIVSECNIELSSMLDNIEDNSGANRIVMEGEQADWSEVIALFAVKVAGTDDETAEDVVVITEEKKQKLKDVFWQMNSITSRTETITSVETTETVLYITINHKTKDDMINEYHFTVRQQEALATLLENNDILIAGTQSLAISDGTAQDVIRTLPESLPAKRKAVIKAACSLVGKVNYFWGGKSSAIGWDSQWGKMTLVTAEGSRTSGSMRPFGLDCSGFVTWSFINSGFSASQIGHGTQGQIATCIRLPWSQAQPGDLAFLSNLSHVGIVAGKDASGNILVIHCASSQNNVVITTNSIFGFAARPGCY